MSSNQWWLPLFIKRLTFHEELLRSRHRTCPESRKNWGLTLSLSRFQVFGTVHNTTIENITLPLLPRFQIFHPWIRWGSISSEDFPENADGQWPHTGVKRRSCRQGGERRCHRGDSFRRWSPQWSATTCLTIVNTVLRARASVTQPICYKPHQHFDLQPNFPEKEGVLISSWHGATSGS